VDRRLPNVVGDLNVDYGRPSSIEWSDADTLTAEIDDGERRSGLLLARNLNAIFLAFLEQEGVDLGSCGAGDRAGNFVYCRQ
jgi:hypothetical protein